MSEINSVELEPQQLAQNPQPNNNLSNQILDVEWQESGERLLRSTRMMFIAQILIFGLVSGFFDFIIDAYMFRIVYVITMLPILFISYRKKVGEIKEMMAISRLRIRTNLSSELDRITMIFDEENSRINLMNIHNYPEIVPINNDSLFENNQDLEFVNNLADLPSLEDIDSQTENDSQIENVNLRDTYQQNVQERYDYTNQNQNVQNQEIDRNFVGTDRFDRTNNIIERHANNMLGNANNFSFVISPNRRLTNMNNISAQNQAVLANIAQVEDSLNNLVLQMQSTRTRISRQEENLRPLTNVQINKLRMSTFDQCDENTQNENVDCPICYVGYEKTDKIRYLKCNHFYHKDCIDVWLKNKPLCPICKSNTKP